jgi:hypothetical protein
MFAQKREVIHPKAKKDASRTQARPEAPRGCCFSNSQTCRDLKLPPENDEVGKLRAEVVNLLQLTSE